MNDAPQWGKIYKCLPIGHVNSYWIKSYTSEKKTILNLTPLRNIFYSLNTSQRLSTNKQD